MKLDAPQTVLTELCMICPCISDDVEINSFEVVPEPESIPPDDDEELSRMMSASKISSKVKEDLPQITFK